ncbi:class A beta-lactamase [Actinocrispum wychmicini]|nr:class A beta-lactamase [Actinocrispum wychmicini]
MISAERNPVSRRAVLAALTVLSLVSCSTATPAQPPASTPVVSTPPKQPDFGRLERDFDARLGVYAVDTANGREVAFRADERFAYASTHKVFTAGAVLQRIPIGDLERTVKYSQNDLVANSPVSEKQVATGMTLRAAMDAAIRYSDNTADNLLFRELGGPNGLAAAVRATGDTTTHVDRIEPALNDTAPGDIRDTSTPRAMTATMRAFTLGNALPEDKRTILVDLMRANQTGGTVIRAGVPAGWQVGDKTGTGGYGTRNDIALVWPPQRAPILLAILSDKKAKDAKTDDKLIAQAAAAALAAFQ